MLAKIYSGAVYGIDAQPIMIETHISPGLQYAIVGQIDIAVKESLYRVESAINNSAVFRMPRKRVVVSLSPADVRKEGSAFDLAVAIGILAASGQASEERLADFLFLGELALDGTLQKVRGALSVAIMARKQGFKGLILPKENAAEGAIVSGLEVYGAENLAEVIHFLNDDASLERFEHHTRELFFQARDHYDLDFADVRGQEEVKRALEISAAGGHNVLMIGSPGAGKTMLAHRLPTILPPLTLQESLEATRVHSVAGKLDKQGALLACRPFRAPHHTISDVALVGGGTLPQPGEISLAHNGVLFLDEFPEFRRSTLEVMRQPLEERQIVISRAKGQLTYPAGFILVAAMNPCPCGFRHDPQRKCTCSARAIANYMGKISGPLLDRIDLQIKALPVPFSELSGKQPGESSNAIRERVMAARHIQQERFAAWPDNNCNAQMNAKMVREFCGLDDACIFLLRQAMEKHQLSARAYDRILKVARTIADLSACAEIGLEHLAEAIGYRTLDRHPAGLLKVVG